MADDDPLAVDVLQHGRGDFSGERALRRFVAVLASDSEGSREDGTGVLQVDGRAANDHLSVGIQTGLGQVLGDILRKEEEILGFS